MKKRILSVILLLALVLGMVPGASVSAATGYDRGYTGSMPGDGKIYTEGLDVSSWQGADLDFQNFADAGYDYVILRCGTTKGKDTCFETYYANAKAAGLDVGAYYYSYATSVDGAYADAANMLSWLGDKTFEYPIYFDYEDSSQGSIDGTTAGKICLAFMDTLRDAGYLVGLYSMASWIDQDWVTTSGIRGKYEGWVARYLYSGEHTTWDPTYSVQYGMYQYTDSKYVNGAGPFDANVCYKDYPTIVKTYGFNGYQSAYYHTITFESNGGSAVESVSVADKDTLTAPANPTRYGFNFVGWYCNPELTDPYDFSTPVPYSFTLYAKWEEAYWGVQTDLLPVKDELVLVDYDGTGQYIWPYYNDDGSVTLYNGVTNDANYSWPSAYMAYENSIDSVNDGLLYVRYASSAQFNAVIEYMDADGKFHSVRLSELAGNGAADFPAGSHEILVDFGGYVAEQGHLTPTDGSTHSRNVKFTRVTYFVVGELDSYVRLYEMGFVHPPKLTGNGFTLSFEDEILVNLYFTAENVTGAEVGMLVFNTAPDTVDMASADAIYKNVAYDTATGQYMASTDGIAAKEMGDTHYYVAYAKLSNGSCVYSPVYEYSPKQYALSRLENSDSAALKALCAAMLNYGAAAQEYFGYKADELMNAGLTAQQQALVAAYDASLFTGAVTADPAKTVNFAKNAEAFTSRSASVSFEGAFAINYYFAPSASVDEGLTLYYWDTEAYAAADVLTADNASGSFSMVANADGSYWGAVSGIAAKELDDTYYVAGVYTSDTGARCTGIIAYSLSKYCMKNAVEGKAMQPLAAAAAVYGYHAKGYFGA